MRGLRVREEMLAGVADDGDGDRRGPLCRPAVRRERSSRRQGATLLEEKALRAAAQRAVGPGDRAAAGPAGRRAGRGLRAEPRRRGAVARRGGRRAGRRPAPFAAAGAAAGRARPDPARERAARRLEAFVAGEADRRLAPLRQLEAAVADGQLKGLARGLAYRLIEAGGVLDRAGVRAETTALSQVGAADAAQAWASGSGAFSLYLPALLQPEARALAAGLRRPEAHGWRPPADAAEPPARRRRPPRACSPPSACAPCGGLAVPVEQLERAGRAAARRRRTPERRRGASPTQAREELGWSADEAARDPARPGLRAGRGPSPASRSPGAARSEKAEPRRRRAAAHSPFAALAALKAPPPAPARRRRRRRPPPQSRPRA